MQECRRQANQPKDAISKFVREWVALSLRSTAPPPDSPAADSKTLAERKQAYLVRAGKEIMQLIRQPTPNAIAAFKKIKSYLFRALKSQGISDARQLGFMHSSLGDAVDSHLIYCVIYECLCRSINKLVIYLAKERDIDAVIVTNIRRYVGRLRTQNSSSGIRAKLSWRFNQALALGVSEELFFLVPKDAKPRAVVRLARGSLPSETVPLWTRPPEKQREFLRADPFFLFSLQALGAPRFRSQEKRIICGALVGALNGTNGALLVHILREEFIDSWFELINQTMNGPMTVSDERSRIRGLSSPALQNWQAQLDAIVETDAPTQLGKTPAARVLLNLVQRLNMRDGGRSLRALQESVPARLIDLDTRQLEKQRCKKCTALPDDMAQACSCRLPLSARLKLRRADILHVLEEMLKWAYKVHLEVTANLVGVSGHELSRQLSRPVASVARHLKTLDEIISQIPIIPTFFPPSGKPSLRHARIRG